jgi:hypothetical protein
MTVLARASSNLAVNQWQSERERELERVAECLSKSQQSDPPPGRGGVASSSQTPPVEKDAPFKNT